MNIFIVMAHPEKKSLNGSLLDFTVSYLKDSGHSVRVSDLYAMDWEARVSVADSQNPPENRCFDPSYESSRAFSGGFQSNDISREQENIMWADAVIFQFPLWWFSMPAILKGWIDRVYAFGFAYGVGEHNESHWGDRYGEGTMKGKRAMLMVTAGGWESHYSSRGINGSIDEILFPIQHGMLFYPGFDVLPPFVIYRTNRIDAERYDEECNKLGERLDNLFITPPIPFYRQNSGDYNIPELTLRDDINPGESGVSIHTARTL